MLLKLWASNNKNSLKKTSFHGYWFTFKKDGYVFIRIQKNWIIYWPKSVLSAYMALWNSSIHRAQPDVGSIILLKLAAFHFSWKVKDKDL